MNGLEAIELMKQGKMVKRVDHDLRFRLNGDRVEGVIPGEVWRDGWIFDINTKYEEYIERKPLTGWERVGENESYYYISCNCYVEKLIEERCMEDKYYYEDANYFSTEEKAEEIDFKQTLFRKLQRFSDENGGSEIDWNDENQCKYHIKYRHYSNKFFVDGHHTIQELGAVYFISEEIAKQAIELFHDDLIKYFTHDWSEGK